MAFHKARRLCRQLFRGGGGFPGGLCAMSGGLLCPLLVLLSQPLFLPVAFEGAFRELRVLLSGGVEMIVRLGLDKLRLGPAHRFCRVLPDFALYKPGAVPQAGLAHKLRAVGPLGSYIFLLHLKNLAMHKAVDGAPGHTARPFHRAGLFGWFLFCQLFSGGPQLFPLFFHAELAGGGLFLLAFLSEFGLGRLWDTLSRSSLSRCPGLLFRASPKSRAARIGGPAPGVSGACLRPGLRAWFIRFSFHFSYPPGGWSAGYKSPPWGNGQQTGWSHSHKTAGPRRN